MFLLHLFLKLYPYLYLNLHKYTTLTFIFKTETISESDFFFSFYKRNAFKNTLKQITRVQRGGEGAWEPNMYMARQYHRESKFFLQFISCLFLYSRFSIHPFSLLGPFHQMRHHKLLQRCTVGIPTATGGNLSPAYVHQTSAAHRSYLAFPLQW